ncbi:HD domain-containing protein [Paenibacillus psychroresistens]|uniref:HD domain-containing protein n=1 Tax=Paenibacillus psychroresistens TaxID=1778678 RepID=A0A6B8RDL2_9BACL|nr:HD domain-containing phosphohydrolase [Paenibacillus psychroresistens]QGQ94007.1 HD domain-containing protein [Paenibacillus psychroresistens]
MEDSTSGLIFRSKDNPVEKVTLSDIGLQLKLVSSGDGTEIIHHRLTAGSRWGLSPADGWEALEFIYILTGSLIWQSSQGKRTLQVGDSISAQPIKTEAIFIAQTDCEFIYVSSQPVFYHYSQNAQELMKLTIDIEEKDGYTADHCHNIMNLSMLLGEHMGLSSNQLVDLNFGSFLHDIGKIMVPDNILGKPGKFTNEEFEIMKKHTTLGRKILYDTGLSNLKTAGIIVEQHHERFDGSGYPYQLKGNDTNICSAIVAVVDSYDAITAKRVYKEAVPKEDALLEMERSRHKYHPDVMAVFFQLADQL